MVTDVLLLVGVVAAVVFVAVLVVEGASRPGYNLSYHTVSELSLGQRGWIQRTNFFVMGAGVFAFAIGVQRSLESTIGAALLALFGFGFVAPACSFPTLSVAIRRSPRPIVRLT